MEAWRVRLLIDRAICFLAAVEIATSMISEVPSLFEAHLQYDNMKRLYILRDHF
jgi:hypothetical protein